MLLLFCSEDRLTENVIAGVRSLQTKSLGVAPDTEQYVNVGNQDILTKRQDQIITWVTRQYLSAERRFHVFD